jgi:hypothetical protein
MSRVDVQNDKSVPRVGSVLEGFSDCPHEAENRFVVWPGTYRSGRLPTIAMIGFRV